MLRVHLLGRPFAERGGRRLPPPRGRKAWALLAYLACVNGSHSREQLAVLLFADADDPLGALRWNLAEARRLLGDSESLKGESITMPDAVVCDVRVAMNGASSDALALPGLGRELLEGLSFPTSPAFESWLLNERRHQQAIGEAVLREESLDRLGAGDTEAAIDLAAKLVSIAPFEEAYQELLIRTYAVAGDRRSAQRQLAACIELYRRELGVEPGPSVFAAADASSGSTVGPSVSGPAAARAQLDAGRAAIDAGAVDAGIECLRRAVAEAQSCGDLSLKAEALVALGSAFVHMARGRDEEGAAVLHEAMFITATTGQDALTTTALLELAWIEVLAGRYERALAQLERAAATSGGEPGEVAMLTVMRGATFLEMGRYREATSELDDAVALAEASVSRRELAYAFGEQARLTYMLGDLDRSRELAESALALARGEHMISMQPLVQGFLGIVQLRTKAPVEQVAETLQHAFAFGCQIGDPCAESAAAHGLGLVYEARGDVAGAIATLEDARSRCLRRGDSSVWLQAWALDSLCRVALAASHPNAATWIAELEALAGRCGMRDFLARSFLHLANVGDDAALHAAEMLADEVGAPPLTQAVERARSIRESS